MKTIAIIASCDTKHQEVRFMRERLALAGVKALVVDMAIGPGASREADISRKQVALGAGVRWDEVKNCSKGELIELMTNAVKLCILDLYRRGSIHGVLAAGGVQNTTVAVSAMQALPIGFPKVMATTIASGARPFGSVVGNRDIVVIPSICDFTGLNTMTRVILTNACACVVGLCTHGGQAVEKPARPLVGMTLMGVTNTGACAAVEELDRLGIEAVGFHSTGVGGRIMEELAEDGLLDGILDLTTHEITAEYFGGGFSYGAVNRLVKPAMLGIPMVVSVGGLDFIDFDQDHFPPRMEQRVSNMHNATLAHIKILPDEAAKIGTIFAQLLNLAQKGVRLLLPTLGMRSNTRPRESLYSPETDDALLSAICEQIGDKVRVQQIEGNVNDAAFGILAARAMADELAHRGKE